MCWLCSKSIPILFLKTSSKDFHVNLYPDVCQKLQMYLKWYDKRWIRVKNYCAFSSTVAVYSCSIANNFVIEILCQIVFSSIANYFSALSICAWFFEKSIWEIITNSKKNRFQNKLDFLSSSNLIFTACVACKNQFRNQIDFLIF